MKHALKLWSSLLFASLLIFTSCFNSDPEPTEKKISDNGSDSFYDSLTGKTVTEAELDSLFELLVERVENLADAIDTADELSDTYAQNFDTLAEEFGAITKIDSTNMKANVGYIVARICALNHNSKLQKIADSLDAYYIELDEYWDSEEELNRTTRAKKSVFGKAYRKNGINGLGTTIFARSAGLLRQNSAKPSFPRYLTMNYIQNSIESEIMPALNGVVDALERVEGGSKEQSLLVVVDNEEYEIDLGDIYVLDAGVRMLRHSLSFLTAYNMDVQAPNGDDMYAVVDSMVLIDGVYRDMVRYTLSGDTLVEMLTYGPVNDDEVYGYLYDVMKHNMNRSDFLKLERKNHARMYEDIKAVPVKLKAAIAHIKNETDIQDNDILKLEKVEDLDAEMLDIANELEAEGLSTEFSSNFKTPEAFADFILELLSSEYTFEEEVNGVHFDVTINLSKFYTNPMNSLKDWLPLHTFNEKEDMIVYDSYDTYTESYSGNYFMASTSDWYDTVVVDIPEIVIDSVYGNEYYLKESLNWYSEQYVDMMFVPVSLVDDEGKIIASDWDELEDAILGYSEFPYFKDYTFNGLFPGMTREKMENLISDIEKAL